MNNEGVMNEKNLRDLINNVPCGIGIFAVTEQSVEVIYLNDGFYRMIGKERQERNQCAGEQNTFFYVHPEDMDVLQQRYTALYNGENSGECEFRIDLGNGKYCWVALRYTVASRAKDRVIAYGAYSNITRVKSSELAAIKRYNEEIAAQNTLPNTVATFRMNITTGLIEAVNIAVPEAKQLEQLTDLDEFLKNELQLIVYPEDRDLVEQTLNLSYLTGLYDQGENNIYLEYRRKMSSGEHRWIGTNMSLLKRPSDGQLMAFAYVVDVTMQRIVENMMESIASVHYDYLMAIDLGTRRYTIYRGSSAFDEIEKCEGSYDVDMPAHECRCLKEEWERCKEQMDLDYVCQQLEQRETYSVYLGIVDNDGAVRRKKMTFSWIGKKREFLMLARADVTDLYDSEQDKNRQLMAALSQAENASRAKSDFLSHMSHEIRTPLNGIKGMVDLMREKEEFQSNEYLEKVRLSTRYLMRLINDILDMSKIESGKIQLEHDILTVTEFCSSIDAIIKPLADEKYIDYGCRKVKTIHKGILVDAGRFKQIMLNILSNAVKYTEPYGMVNYYIEEIDLPPHRSRISLIVEDNGVGMSEEFIRAAFDPFTQERRTYNHSGTGLGLAITKQLLELMGGKIRIESQQGAGTKVYLDLETEWTDNLEVLDRDGKVVSKHYHFETLDFSGRRVLLAEDNEINMEIAELQLQNIGLEVHRARDGAEAVKLMEMASESFYDIIFMDIMMPIMDGLEATQVIRNMVRQDVKSIPIVAMTANAFVEDIHKSLESGMNYHLSKPFEKEQMLQILAQAFFIR